MPLPTLTPPADPVVIYATAGTTPGSWTFTRSNGTVILSNAPQTPEGFTTLPTALRAAGVAPTALVTILSPSGNMYASAQLRDWTGFDF
jgi:hypothetical protein